MISLRTVIAILASLLAVAQAMPTSLPSAPVGNLPHRPVRSADDLKASASYGYGYGYGYPYGGFYGGYGGYGWGGYGGYGYGGYGYGYPYYHGVYLRGYGYGYPYGGYGFWH